MRVKLIHGYKDIAGIDEKVEAIRKKYIDKFSVFNGEMKEKYLLKREI